VVDRTRVSLGGSIEGCCGFPIWQAPIFEYYFEDKLGWAFRKNSSFTECVLREISVDTKLRGIETIMTEDNPA